MSHDLPLNFVTSSISLELLKLQTLRLVSSWRIRSAKLCKKCTIRSKGCYYIGCYKCIIAQKMAALVVR